MIPTKMPKEVRDQLISGIQGYFIDERGEEIGELAAGMLLDFFMKEAGPYLYNQGVHDAKELLQQKVMNMEEDLESLKRPIEMNRRY